MATELAKAYVQIIPSARGIKGSLTSALDGEATSAGKSAGTTIASKIKGAIAAAGIGVALTKTISSALNEGAALQQSLGGIETLFKDSADKVIKNAENAYKTAGLSANEYMTSVTSFSASLLQGLSGDTEKAADIADMALTDMSDNANKMGTSIEMIQNAYQGFAKQNYTMLDNLKLGYGGTKKEMERLLADAEKLTGVEYDISNLSDIYEAIHAIQDEMGITGTTALEASATYSGALASMVSAGKNVLANLALGEDITPSLQTLGNTIVTFGKNNLVPMVGNIVLGVISVVKENGIEMLSSGANMLTSFINGISSKIPELMPKAFEAIVTFADTILANFPTILNAGIGFIKSIIQGIIESLPTLIVEAPRIINEFANAIYSALGELIATGLQMIISLVKGLWENRGLIIENAGQIFMAFLNVFSLSNLFNLGKNLILNLKNGITNMASNPVAALKEIGQKAVEAVKNIKWSDLGKNIVQGIVNGIKNNVKAIVSSLTAAASGALASVKKVLGIKSPSRVFQNEVGKMIDLGLAAGIEKNVGVVSDSMKELSSATVGMINTDFAVSMASSRELAGSYESTNTVSQIVTLLDRYLPAVANMQLVTDTGALVGQLAPKMNDAFSDIMSGNERGM